MVPSGACARAALAFPLRAGVSAHRASVRHPGDPWHPGRPQRCTTPRTRRRCLACDRRRRRAHALAAPTPRNASWKLPGGGSSADDAEPPRTDGVRWLWSCWRPRCARRWLGRPVHCQKGLWLRRGCSRVNLGRRDGDCPGGLCEARCNRRLCGSAEGRAIILVNPAGAQ